MKPLFTLLLGVALSAAQAVNHPGLLHTEDDFTCIGGLVTLKASPSTQAGKS
jgi:hypothetical protein